MNHLEKTFWDMQKSSISFARDNETIWITNTVIKADFDALVKNELDLSSTVKTQSESFTNGYVAQKKQDTLLLAKAVYKLSRNLSYLAKKNNNQVLLNTVDISESGFVSGEEKEILLRFKTVLEASRTELAKLDVYNVTSEQLDLLDTQLKNLHSMPETISVVVGNRKSATRTIKELISEAREILDRLDDAFEGIINDDTFLEGWFDSRKIKGRHSNKRSNGETLEVNIINE